MERFRLASTVTRIEPLGRQLLVFNAASYETHLVNEAAGALLQFMADSPRACEELQELLTELLNDHERGGAQAHARSALNQLQSLGLVTAVCEP